MGYWSWALKSWHCRIVYRRVSLSHPHPTHNTTSLKMRGKATTLSNLLDVDSEDDFARADEEVMLTPDSAIENRATKSRRQPAASSRTAASKVTKTKPASKRASATATSRLKRSALLERENIGNASDTEVINEDDESLRRIREEEEEMEMVKQAKRAKTAKADAALKARKAKASRTQDSDGEVEPRAKATAARSTTARATKPQKRAISKEPRRTVPETQQDPTEVTDMSLAQEEYDEPTPKPVRKTIAQRARSASRQRQPLRRAGSASDTERTGDPALRRKLGDITRQLDNMQLKYNNLREVGMRDADSNFDKLKKTTEQRAKGIVLSLKTYKKPCLTISYSAR